MMDVFDSSVLPLLQEDEGCEIVKGVLRSAHKRETQLIMSEINCADTLHISAFHPARGRMAQPKHLSEMLPLRLVRVTLEVLEKATEMEMD